MNTLNPFAWLSRWLDRRIDARIAGWNACRQADFFEMDGDAERLAQWEPAARAAGWKPRRARPAVHPITTPSSPDTVEIDGEAYLIRRSVGRPTVLVQVATAREVELPAPAQAGGR